MEIIIVKTLENHKIFPEGSIVVIQQDKKNNKINAFSPDENVKGFLLSVEKKELFNLMLVKLTEEEIIEYFSNEENISISEIYKQLNIFFLYLETSAISSALASLHPFYGVYITTDDFLIDSNIIPADSQFVIRISSATYDIMVNAWISQRNSDKVFVSEMTLEDLLIFRNEVLIIPEDILEAVNEEMEFNKDFLKI